jgi:norsolorinic acid ketoreductase
VQTYLSRPNTTVIATVRDTSSASSKALASLTRGSGSLIITVKLDSAVDTDAQAAIDLLKSSHAITHLDVVIANAGIANWWGRTLEAPTAEFRSHFDINTLGTVTLFQATWPLLEKSSDPKFVYISTVVGSIGEVEKWPLDGVVYGASKAAMNYIVRKIHVEHQNLTVFPLHPG